MLAWPLTAGPSQDVNDLKSAFLYQFSKYATWNPEPSKVFTIAVINDDKVFERLKSSLKNKKRNDLPITVKQVSPKDDLSNIQMLYIGKIKPDLLKTTCNKLKHSILIVTHGKNLASHGAGLNFYLADRKLRFEANQETLKKHKIKLSAQLLKLAKVVE